MDVIEFATIETILGNDFWQNKMSDSVDPLDMVSSGLKRPAPVVVQNEESGELEVPEVVKRVAIGHRQKLGFCIVCKRHPSPKLERGASFILPDSNFQVACIAF